VEQEDIGQGDEPGARIDVVLPQSQLVPQEQKEVGGNVGVQLQAYGPVAGVRAGALRDPRRGFAEPDPGGTTRSSSDANGVTGGDVVAADGRQMQADDVLEQDQDAPAMWIGQADEARECLARHGDDRAAQPL